MLPSGATCAIQIHINTAYLPDNVLETRLAFKCQPVPRAGHGPNQKQLRHKVLTWLCRRDGKMGWTQTWIYRSLHPVWGKKEFKLWGRQGIFRLPDLSENQNQNTALEEKKWKEKNNRNRESAKVNSITAWDLLQDWQKNILKDVSELEWPIKLALAGDST